MLTLPAAPLLPTWAALRLHATYLRCPKENPDAPDEWCDNCNRRATARAELAAVKKDIRATERKMLRALSSEVSK